MKLLLLPQLCLLALVSAQIPLPNPPWLPANATQGAQPSSASQIPNTQWSNLLGSLLYFYDAQRSGSLPSSNRVSWRNSSCLDDGKDVGLDLTGGYYDAGDYIKATFPLSFALMNICWQGLEFGHAYDLANQTAYLDSMLRWGLDWLIKAHPSNQTLYVLVGDGVSDGEYWGGDQNIPQSRASYAVNASSPGTDAAAGASAAFSMCSRLYANASLGDRYSSTSQLANSTYSSTLLSHAQDLWTFATTASGGFKLYSDSVPAIREAYGSSSYEDELTLATLLLAWATNSTSLYQQAQNYYTSFKIADQGAEYGWDNKYPAIPILFTQLYAAGFGNLSTYRSDTERYLDNVVYNVDVTRGGLLWYDHVSDQASLDPALNAAALAIKYAPLANDLAKQRYTDFADRQLQYALGKNPMNVPYVVGLNPNSPSNPHSALASGGNDIGQIDTLPKEEAYILYGAVIGGPDRKDRYFDIRSDWVQSEVALDYNSPLMTLAAHRVLNDAKDPFYTSLQDGAYEKVKPTGQPCDAAIRGGCNGKGMPTKARIGVYVTVGTVGLIIIVLWACWLWSLQKNKA
ncbi:glycoside hydrolase family 9 protein [Flagelloscypha sp. PMI_526]|nr:glycoside hydrolase family 9 protein [Flagelloscypha sp. PMI_526]